MASPIGSSVPAPLEPRSEQEIMADWGGTLSDPKVSVICHTYNHASYISDAINGFLAQKSSFPFEIIIHDDASTDATRSIIEKYLKRYPNLITLVAQEENQFSQGRRPPSFTFRKARGEFIALCEGDDFWIDRNKLSKQVDLLDDYTSVDICVHPGYQLMMSSNSAKIFCRHGENVTVMGVSTVLEQAGQFSPTASLMFRKRAALNLPEWFFNAPDLPFGDFFIETIIGRFGILYTSDVMSVYRWGVEGSHTQREGKKNGEELVQAFEREVRFIRNLAAYDEIPAADIEKTLSFKRRGYAVRFIAINDYGRFKCIVRNGYAANNFAEFLVLRSATTSTILFRLLYVALDFYRRKVRAS